MAVLVKKSFFQNISPNFHFFQKSFAAQFSTNLAQFSTTFVFSKKQNDGANFLDIPFSAKQQPYHRICNDIIILYK